MPTYNAQFILTTELIEPDPFQTGNRTTAYKATVLLVTGADRHHTQYHTLSAELSAHEVPLTPLGSAAPSAALLLLHANHPVDVRLGNASNVAFSAVQFLLLAGMVSGLFLNTGVSTAVLTEVIGGSNTTITVTQSVP